MFQMVYTWSAGPVDMLDAGAASLGDFAAAHLPAGWLHWLVGDGDGDAAPAAPHGWHVLFGGSFFPDCHEAHGEARATVEGAGESAAAETGLT